MSATIQHDTVKYPKYPMYKPSGIDWLGDVPGSWDIKRLKYLCSKVADYGLNIEAENYLPQGIRFIRTSDIDDEGHLSEKGVYLDPEKVPQEYLLTEGDILLSRSGTIGRSYCHEGRTETCSYAGYLVRLLKTRFASYFFHSNAFFDWIKTQLIETTIGNVNGQKYANIDIPTPSDAEQQAIVGFLDRKTALIDDVIAKKQKLIELLKEKRQALITHAVTKGLDPNAKLKPSGIEWLGDIPEGWEVKRLKYLFKVQNGATPKSSIDEYWDGDILWITPDDLGRLNGLYIEDTARKITTQGYQSCGTALVPSDSIILSTRAPIGHLGVARSELCMNQGCRGLVFKTSRVEKRYFYYLFEIIKCELQSLGQGATFTELSKTKLESVFLPVPTEPEQIAITDFLDRETAKIDEVVIKVKEQIKKLKEYRQTLITSAVTGKIKILPKAEF